MSFFLTLMTSAALLLSSESQILIPTAVIGADGEAHEGWAVHIADGRIVEVGPKIIAPEGSRTFHLDGVLSPGFVDAFTTGGIDRTSSENSRALTPQLQVADALDLGDKFWQDRLAEGFTAVHVVPSGENVLSGWSVVVSPGAERGEVLKQKARPMVSLIERFVSDSRIGPSALTGAVDLYRAGLESGLLRQSPVVFVEQAEAVRAVNRVHGEWLGHMLDTSDSSSASYFIAKGDLADYGALLAGQIVGIMALPEYGWSSRTPETLKALGKAKVQPAFGSSFTKRTLHSNRQAAMMWSRLARDPLAAMRGLTIASAELAGVADQLGSIQAGKRADLVLWSAHPLDATARVRAVMIGGKTVFHGSPPQSEVSK
ncbi:MAG: amidohydrolase family protein [Planctomycetes bacterium]|nr:amidohydrolase family protein [Planctomycetota bacterium]